MALKKFTFKTEQPVGKYRSFDTPEYKIKFNGRWVGNFEPTDRGWKISLMVMKDARHNDSNPNCPWVWVVLKVRPATLEMAKEYLNSLETLTYIHSNLTLLDDRETK